MLMYCKWIYWPHVPDSTHPKAVFWAIGRPLVLVRLSEVPKEIVAEMLEGREIVAEMLMVKEIVALTTFAA
ncbi:hypothetical protein ACLKA6_007571 [Drosophila palustris]